MVLFWNSTSLAIRDCGSRVRVGCPLTRGSLVPTLAPPVPVSSVLGQDTCAASVWIMCGRKSTEENLIFLIFGLWNNCRAIDVCLCVWEIPVTVDIWVRNNALKKLRLNEYSSLAQKVERMFDLFSTSSLTLRFPLAASHTIAFSVCVFPGLVWY